MLRWFRRELTEEEQRLLDAHERNGAAERALRLAAQAACPHTKTDPWDGSVGCLLCDMRYPPL